MTVKANRVTANDKKRSNAKIEQFNIEMKRPVGAGQRVFPFRFRFSQTSDKVELRRIACLVPGNYKSVDTPMTLLPSGNVE